MQLLSFHDNQRRLLELTGPNFSQPLEQGDCCPTTVKNYTISLFGSYSVAGPDITIIIGNFFCGVTPITTIFFPSAPKMVDANLVANPINAPELHLTCLKAVWLIDWLRWLRFIGKVNWINQHIEHHQARCVTRDHDSGFCTCTDVSLGRSPRHFTKLKFGIEILKIQLRRWVVIADCMFVLEYDRCTLFDFLKYIYFLFASSHLHHESILITGFPYNIILRYNVPC